MSFGFDGSYGADVRPVHRAAVSSWAKDESAPGVNDGTRFTASWVNRMTGNIRRMATLFGVTLTETGDDDLAACVTAAVGVTPPAPHVHDERYYTEAEVDAIRAALKAEILGGVGPAWDTLQELYAELVADEAAVAALTTVVGQKLAKASNLSDLVDTASARTNLGGTALGIALFTGVSAAALRASTVLNIDAITGRGDANYTITATDRVVATNAALTASRTWTLPAASAVNAGQALTIADVFGGVTAVNTIAIQRAGSDTINGTTTMTLGAPFGAILLVSDGASKWSAMPLGTASGVPSKASQSQAEAGSNDTTFMTPLTVQQQISNRQLGFKNILGRNGGLEVWQTGTTSAAPAQVCDGFYASSSAAAVTLTRVSGIIAGSQFSGRVRRTAGNSGAGVVRVGFALDADELFLLRGGTAVLSFAAQAGANWSPASGTLSYALYCGTGAVARRQATSYTGETTPITGTVNLTPGGAAQTMISAFSSAVASNITCAEVQFFWTPAGTAGAADDLTIDNVQLELVPAGVTTIVPAFEYLPFGVMLRRCERFYEQTYDYSVAPYGVSSAGSVELRQTLASTVFSCGQRFRARKRVAPTVTIGNPISTGSGSLRDVTGAVDFSVTSVDDIGDSGFARITLASAPPANNRLQFHYVADARI